ncbi:hypothetical protein SSS_05683 [Sarcoptes scabiei]|nr:hypothetical protein SSS_05683 [Sarcoptes scabiei]
MMPNNRDNSDDNDVNEQRELNRIKSPESIDSSHQDIFFLETNEKQSNVENKSIECDNGRSTRHSTIDQPSPRSTKSTLNSSTNQLPKFGITPPNYISLDEIMKTANEMNRLALVNEIVLDKDFKLERRSTDPNRLESVIRETMKKAFWDIVAEEFNQNPPNYRQAITLMTEIKETLLLFLMPQHSQLKNAIEETLDIELIEQKITNEIFEFKDYAKFVLSVCGRLCCPARDEMISKLNEITDTIPLIRGIFELLEIMRIDFANFYIKQFRPHIQLTSVEYEREKFENLMKSHRKYNIDVLEFTTKWIKRNYESLDLTQESDMKTLFSKVMISSYLDLLQSIQPGFDCYSALIDEKKTNDETMTVQDDYPETLLFYEKKSNRSERKYSKSPILAVYLW